MTNIDISTRQNDFIDSVKRGRAPTPLKIEDVDPEVVRRVNTARLRMMRNRPFEAALLAPMKLYFVGDEIPTAATDCYRRIWLNADFFSDMDVQTTETVIAHEVYHPALLHGVRRGGRRPDVWNWACDLYINRILQERGYSFHAFKTIDLDGLKARLRNPPAPDPDADPVILLDPSLDMDHSAEWIYNQLMQAMPPQDEQSPDMGSGFDSGDIRDDLQGEGGDGDGDAESQKPDASDLAREMGQRVSAGAVGEKALAKRQGTHVDAWLKRFIDDNLEDKVNWRVLLQRFVKSALARDDYSMRRPSRRGLMRGVVLPSLRSEMVKEIRVVCDTSGSVTNEELSRYAAEVSGIINRANAKTTLVAFVDTEVRSVQTFSRRDKVVFEPAGGGGTNMRKGFDWAAEGKPDLFVMFTDGHTGWPDEKPAFPTVVVLAGGWVADKSTVPDWAHVIEIED